MEKTEFLEKLKSLVASEDVIAVSREVSELKSQFEDFLMEEERKRQVLMLEAQENGENTTELELHVPDELKTQFYAVYDDFKHKKNEVLKQLKREQEENYAIKRSLLDRLRMLIENEENIKTAYDVSKEIHEKWMETGDVAREKRLELQQEYSRLRETFFSNLKIFKELREYDLKKNHQIKLEIIEKVKGLLLVDNIKKIEETLKALQNEFDTAGPVPYEEWENIRDAYWNNVRAVYQKVHEFYEERRNTLQENIDKKSALLEKAKTFVHENQKLATAKEWEKATASLIEMQEEWKGIGYGLKKQNEELWAEFRAQCDLFFANKRVFYDNLKADFEINAAKKRELIQQVEQVKTSTDWAVATKKIINLQERWKKTGHAGIKNEQGLWKEFRAACDYYFQAKDNFFKEQDQSSLENLKIKQAIIERIKAYQVSDDKKQSLADLKNFATEFNAVGKVPFKDKDIIYNEFRTALDGHYSKLKLDGEEKEKALFQAELSTMKAAPNADELLKRAYRDIQQQIQTLNQAVSQYENNLGFFSNANKSNPIIAEIHQKIKGTKQKIENLKLKLKLLNE